MRLSTEGPYRPTIPDEEKDKAPIGYVDMMQKCWDNGPEMRPSIKDVIRLITRLQKETTKLVN